MLLLMLVDQAVETLEGVADDGLFFSCTFVNRCSFRLLNRIVSNRSCMRNTFDVFRRFSS